MMRSPNLFSLQHRTVAPSALDSFMRSLAHVHGRIVELQVQCEFTAPAALREELVGLREQRQALHALIGGHHVALRRIAGDGLTARPAPSAWQGVRIAGNRMAGK